MSGIWQATIRPKGVYLVSERAAEPEAPEVPETEVPEDATKQEIAELREAQKKLADRLEALDQTEPDTAKGKKAAKDVEKAAEEVEEAMEEVGLSEATMDKLADKVADRIAAWADEAEQAEQESKEKGALGDLEQGRQPAPPEATPPAPGEEPEPKRDEVPEKDDGHWIDRPIRRRREA